MSLRRLFAIVNFRMILKFKVETDGIAPPYIRSYHSGDNTKMYMYITSRQGSYERKCTFILLKVLSGRAPSRGTFGIREE